MRPLFLSNVKLMGVLLGTLIFGLTISYIVLIYKVRKYYFDSMKLEIRRLTILFASFNISYMLRYIYLYTSYYHKFAIDDKFTRSLMQRILPIVFDLSSIMANLKKSNLIGHSYITFHELQKG